MTPVVVADTSVLIDLERASLLDEVFHGPLVVSVPDLLFERELRPYGGDRLGGLGLRVLDLDADAVELAASYRRRSVRISVADSFALALAKVQGLVLLSGDAALTVLARSEGVECHGVLWLFDFLEEHSAATRSTLAQALDKLAAHPRCRLPRALVEERLRRYRDSR